MERSQFDPSRKLKILIPNRIFGSATNLHLGGTERFIYLLKKHFSEAEVHIVDYFEEHVKNRKVADHVADFAKRIKPDIIIGNLYSNSVGLNIQRLCPDIPVLMIIHTLADSLSALQFVNKYVDEFYSRGGTIAMVSEYQKNSWEYFCTKRNLPQLKVSAIINPSLVEKRENVFSGQRQFDLVTIGRSDQYKDPYSLHKRIRSLKKIGINLTGIVSTNDKIKEDEYFQRLYSEYHWGTVLNYDTAENNSLLDKSSVFYQTSYRETWGITVMEAFSRGLPCLINCAGDMCHASESIIPDKRFFRMVRKSWSNDEFIRAYNELKDIPLHLRQELANLTYEHNNVTVFCDKIRNAINLTIENFKKCQTTSPTLQSFL